MKLQDVDGHRVEHRSHLGGIRIDEQRDAGHEWRQRVDNLARSREPRRKRGVPRQNTRPIASAPASAAASASAMRVMPQILTACASCSFGNDGARERHRPHRGRKPETRVVGSTGEIQPVGGERGRRARAVAASKHFREPRRRRRLPAPNVGSSAPTMLRTMWCRNALAENSKRTKGPCCVTLDARQRLDRRFRLALGRAKCREIVRAQQLRARPHPSPPRRADDGTSRQGRRAAQAVPRVPAAGTCSAGRSRQSAHETPREPHAPTAPRPRPAGAC